MPNRQGAGGRRVLQGWESLWLPLGEGEERKLPDGRGTGWEPVEVPAQQAAAQGRQALWYRTTFARPDHTGRVLLRFGGAFLATNVWLNGKHVGSHYGYFAAFGFDITPFLKSDNLLVVCCETPIETDLTRKRHITGIFGDGDSRPYPASAYFSLPAEYQWEMPVGLWRPVELEYLGAVAIDWMRLNPRLEADIGRLEIEARLRNLDGREMSGNVVFEITPPQGAPLRLSRDFTIAGGLEKTLSMSMSIPGVQRWWPWRLGASDTYGARAELRVGGELSAVVEDRFGFREMEVRAAPEGWGIRVNGQPIFVRGACYAPDLRLDHLTEERFKADIALAQSANLDAFRVHAHVLPDEFYRCADLAGMIVVADFPLTQSYSYHAAAEEASFFETGVREQVPEMVEMLRNRPSLAWWVVHDDPPWIPAHAEQGDVHTVRQNYSIDQEAKSLFQRLDPSRPALAASGEFDSHCYAGWQDLDWDAFSDLEAGMVSEFGAQSLPTVGSPVWKDLAPQGGGEPAGDADPRWLYAGFQPVPWAEFGAGLPSDHSSLTSLIEASQRYQAWVVRYGIEQIRKRKFEPAWGAFAYQLVDPFPAIGFGLVDQARVAKLGLSALRQAFAPTRVIIDPVGFEVDRPVGVRFRPGRAVVVRLVVVNDDPRTAGAGRVRWWIERDQGPSGGFGQRLAAALRRRAFSGVVELDLPEAWESAVQVASLTLPLEGEGHYRLEAQLEADGRTIDHSSLEFRVGSPAPRPLQPRLMPSFLAERLVVAGSLSRDGAGLKFELLNSARPAVLGTLDDFRLDGHPLLTFDLHLEGGVPLPRRLELPIERPLSLVVETHQIVAPGPHRLEFNLNVPGVASGLVGVEGEL
ncbi:MAG TPA: hypothetical protein VG015_09560 [Candidatus Dormibacteraeota bacterium]|nr:hypothetical protein [Candidatus Dormibacteraeota bacterium]